MNYENTWSRLKDVLEPFTISEDIEIIKADVDNGSLQARVVNPEPTNLSDVDDDKEFSVNQSTSISGDYIDDLLYNVRNNINDSVEILEGNSCFGIDYLIMKPDSVTVSVYIQTEVLERDYGLHSQLATALVNEDRIESEDNLSHGIIDNVFYNDGSIGQEGWEMDGTLYRITEKPYEYWSEGNDSDYPTNMDEWSEFATDSDAEKEKVLSQDTHLIHFHPMKYGMQEDNPLVEWYRGCEDILLTNFNVESEAELYIKDITIDKSRTKLTGYQQIELTDIL